ncbi:hypothetical protein KY284_016822 [Solanum tuberosum]|nr:hypothetical protein KY284_016822 [Solanum tuberosum]
MVAGLMSFPLFILTIMKLLGSYILSCHVTSISVGNNWEPPHILEVANNHLRPHHQNQPKYCPEDL